MDLICTELVNLNDSVVSTSDSTGGGGGGGGGNGRLMVTHKADEDPTFMLDRCLENLLKAEDKHMTECNYFKTVQRDITPNMRKMVAEWVIEICDEQKCQEEVAILALNYMDRFLSIHEIKKTHLQILAAACLLLASKLREPSCRALPANLLVFYTDNSITKKDLIQWELLVLSLLKWDLSTVTPLDFLQLLLSRLPIKSKRCSDITLDKVRKHAQAFISLAAREHFFSIYSASTIAASSIAAALVGLKWHLRTNTKISHLLDRLTDLTGVEQEYISYCMEKMEDIFEEQRRNLIPIYLTATATIDSQYESSAKGAATQQQTVQLTTAASSVKNKKSSTTPTDISEIQF